MPSLAASRSTSRPWLTAFAAAIALVVAMTTLLAVGAPAAVRAAHTYDNPLELVGTVDNPVPGGTVESCADPSVIKGQQAGDDYWYMYCTTDPLSSEDENASGGLNFRLIPQFRSTDLVSWEYMGDAFDTRPPTAAQPIADGDPGGPYGGAGLWAPEIDYDPLTDTYFLFYGVTDMADASSPQSTDGCRNDNGISYATSDSPTGPWVEQGVLIAPRSPDAGETCNFFWTYDPEVIFVADGVGFIYYGSYYGGIHVQPVAVAAASTEGASATIGTTSGTPTRVAIPNKYEGAEVVQRIHDGTVYYYLFVSATNCCVGPLTGYSVFVGRSTSPTGPFVDHTGRPLDPEPADGQAGGTPVLSMNGNDWVGPGHNTVFDDFGGQTWTIYHAIDKTDPYFAGEFGFDKRPALLDPIDWSADGWPNVRNGNWISDGPMPAPAAQPGHGDSAYAPVAPAADEPGDLLAAYSDEFDGDLSEWSWIREPAAAEYGVEAGLFRFDVQKAELHEANNSASVLVREAPTGDYILETRVRLNVGESGCCPNYTQAGVVIYGGTEGTTGDNAYVKLVHAAIWETRQTEFGFEVPPPGPHPGGGPVGDPGEFTAEYGNTVVGPPDTWTLLRIVKRTENGVETYRAYTSRDADENGVADGWHRGGVWTHDLGASRIGLISFNEPANDNWVAHFDWVRVYELAAAGGGGSPSPSASGSAAPTASQLPDTSADDRGDSLPLGFVWLTAALAVTSGAAVVRLRLRRA